MTRRPAASMPDSLRHFMRAGQHPARSVPCPHCHVGQHKPCHVPSSKRVVNQPHPQRVSAWARTVACCPTCQVAPGTPCHRDGRALENVHNRRYQEAEATAA